MKHFISKDRYVSNTKKHGLEYFIVWNQLNPNSKLMDGRSCLIIKKDEAIKLAAAIDKFLNQKL